MAKRRAVAFVKRGLDRVGQARPHVGANLQAIDDDRQRRGAAERSAISTRLVDASRRGPPTSSRPNPRRPQRVDGVSVERIGRSALAQVRAGARSSNGGSWLARRRRSAASRVGVATRAGVGRLASRHSAIGYRSRSAGACRRAAARSATRSGDSRSTSLPHCRQIVRPTRAQSSRR